MERPDWRALAREFSDKIWSDGQALDIGEKAETFLFERGIDLSNLDPQLQASFDRFCDHARSHIARRIQEAADRGVRPNLVFSSAASTLVPFVDADSPSDYPAPQLRAALQREIEQLSPRRFEGLSALVLEFEGVADARVMRGTKEEGVDFYGVVDLGVRIPGPLWKELTFRLLGQAKKSDVGEETVRLLCEDIRAFGAGIGRAYPLTPVEFRDQQTPILGLVFSARHATVPAREYGRARGVAVKDGEQIAELLLRSDLARRRWIDYSNPKDPLNGSAFFQTLDERLL